MTRVLWWRAIGYLEGIGKEGGLVGWLSVRECFDVDTRKKFFSKRVVLHRLKAVGSLLWLVEAVWHAATFVAPAQAPVPLPSVLG